MVKLEGTYEFVSQENYVEYVKSLGVKDEDAQKLAAAKSPVVIGAATADSVTVKYGDKDVTFPWGKEVEHVIGNGHTVWTTVTQSANGFTFNTKLAKDGSVSEEKVVTITDTGLTSNSTSSAGVKSVRTYKRV